MKRVAAEFGARSVCWALLFFLVSPVLADLTRQPPIILATVYQDGIDVSEYWVSEKYDGVRAYWDGQQLRSRSGNVYHAPGWFIADFPAFALDGELWLARGQFQQLLSTVRKNHPVDLEWEKVTYNVFELPAGSGNFSHRLQMLNQRLESRPARFIRVVKQTRVSSRAELFNRLSQVVSAGGEGLMLHRADALYQSGRSHDLLKLKPYQDAEATVIQQLPGKGKFKGMMGSLLVETKDGKRFRIGSGFSDEERRNPPLTGALVTYKFFGKTNRGIPRFASFLRVREQPQLSD